VSAHPWSLVAPWYRWPRYPGLAPRATPPVIQKYESSKLVDMFRANPQHSLQFTGEDSGADKRLKLFLAQHKRFYLVVCELHCDRRGFPNARPDDVCQAGFVLRRRRTPVPEELKQDATRLMQRIGKRRVQIEMLKDDIHAHVAGGAPSAIGLRQVRQHVKRQAFAEQRLERLQGELVQFARTNRLAPVLEGWAPSELEGLGSWSRIEDDVPHDGEEQVYPLFQLIPDPKLTPHAARGRSIYFGLVPTAGAETDAAGAPRLEPKVAYEAQCFVRRHDPRCPRKPGGGRDCRGELTWSAPTQPFTLASPQDLVGTSNRPVTVHLPDLPELLEQARKLPFGAGAPLKMLSPEGSSLPVLVDDDGKAQKAPRGPFQICSFAIPLITIVAFFVFRLFLPIVVLLFGLWPLLKLKFCIPPSIELGLDVELTASLTAFKAGVAVDAAVVTDIKTALDAPAQPFDPLDPAYVPPGMPGSGYNGEKFSQMADGLAPGDLVEVVAAQVLPATDPVFGPRPALPAGTVPSPNSLLAPLVWEPELDIPPIPDFEAAA
jgi:hypothetical protein